MSACSNWLVGSSSTTKTCRTRPSSASANREGRHDFLGFAREVPTKISRQHESRRYSYISVPASEIRKIFRELAFWCSKPHLFAIAVRDVVFSLRDLPTTTNITTRMLSNVLSTSKTPHVIWLIGRVHVRREKRLQASRAGWNGSECQDFQPLSEKELDWSFASLISHWYPNEEESRIATRMTKGL
jgi:hypothetical protein